MARSDSRQLLILLCDVLHEQTGCQAEAQSAPRKCCSSLSLTHTPHHGSLPLWHTTQRCICSMSEKHSLLRESCVAHVALSPQLQTRELSPRHDNDD